MGGPRCSVKRSSCAGGSAGPFPQIQGNASCSVQASLGSKWANKNGSWRGALDLVSSLHTDCAS